MYPSISRLWYEKPYGACSRGSKVVCTTEINLTAGALRALEQSIVGTTPSLMAQCWATCYISSFLLWLLQLRHLWWHGELPLARVTCHKELHTHTHTVLHWKNTVKQSWITGSKGQPYEFNMLHPKQRKLYKMHLLHVWQFNIEWIWRYILRYRKEPDRTWSYFSVKQSSAQM